MEITQTEFNAKLNELTEKNWKVKHILRDTPGGYENLAQRMKDLIDKELGIQRKDNNIFTSKRNCKEVENV